MAKRVKLINKKIFKLSAGKCLFCGESDYALLDIHRIIEGKNLGKYHKHNCLVACSNCHRRIHDGQIKIDRYYPCTGGIDKLRVIIDDKEFYL